MLKNPRAQVPELLMTLFPVSHHPVASQGTQSYLKASKWEAVGYTCPKTLFCGADLWRAAAPYTVIFTLPGWASLSK